MKTMKKRLRLLICGLLALTAIFCVQTVYAATLVSSDPADGATGVATNISTITATFDNDDYSTFVSSGSCTLFPTQGMGIAVSTGTKAYDSATRTISFDVLELLISNTQYTVSVKPGFLGGGNSWTFTTGAGAVPVDSTNPADGAVDVTLNTTVSVTFLDDSYSAIDDQTFTLETAAGNAVTAAVAYDGATRTATLTPSSALDPSTTYTAEIFQTAGQATPDYTWSFTTGAGTTAGQRIPLYRGWNMISYTVNTCFHTPGNQPVNVLSGVQFTEVADIGEVLSSLGSNYVQIKGWESGAPVAYNSSGVGNMTYMAPGNAYWIEIDESAVEPVYLELSGDLITDYTTKSIPLQDGWNFVGYLGDKVKYKDAQPDTGMFPSTVTGYDNLTNFDTLSDVVFTLTGCDYKYVRGYDKTGAKLHIKDQPFFSDLTYVGPGFGYWINCIGAGSMTWK